jgi:hypothetical protein
MSLDHPESIDWVYGTPWRGRKEKEEQRTSELAIFEYDILRNCKNMLLSGLQV